MSLRVYQMETKPYDYLALRVNAEDEPIYVGQGKTVNEAVSSMRPNLEYSVNDFLLDFPNIEEVSNAFAQGTELSVPDAPEWQEAFRVFEQWKIERRLCAQVNGIRVEENIFPRFTDLSLYKTEEEPMYYATVITDDDEPVFFGKGQTPIEAVRHLVRSEYLGKDFASARPWTSELEEKFGEVDYPLVVCSWEEWDMALAAFDEWNRDVSIHRTSARKPLT